MNRSKNWLAPVLGVGAMLTTLLTWQQPANAATPGFDGALTVTTANQVINQYADLTAIDTAVKSITVDDIANLTSGAPVNGGALVTGDLLMLYQAQGATIDVTDTASYGNVTAYNNSGKYQFVTVGSITGNTITLASDSSMTSGGGSSPPERAFWTRSCLIKRLDGAGYDVGNDCEMLLFLSHFPSLAPKTSTKVV